MPDASSQAPYCPECGAALSAEEEACWLCGRKANETKVNPYSPPRPTGETNIGLQFSLASLFLFTTLAAVCFGLFALSPGLGIVVTVVALPALVRTVLATQHRKQAGQRPALSVKIFEFIVSATTVTVAAAAGMVAFVPVCTAASLGSMAVWKDNTAIAIGFGA